MSSFSSLTAIMSICEKLLTDMNNIALVLRQSADLAVNSSTNFSGHPCDCSMEVDYFQFSFILKTVALYRD